jgi:hypothetical protein
VETPKPEYLTQLRCWKTAQIEGISDIQKLKHAYASLHLFTDDSPIHGCVEQMMDVAALEVMGKGGHHYIKQ